VSSGALGRHLGTADAVVIGLGAMIGAGGFSAIAPAAEAAGSGLLIGLGVAAVIAYCNAVASAQLASQYPTSGGTYVYGRERLGPWWGFVAGWGFVIGKTASCAAMALTFAAYALPGDSLVQRPIAVAALGLLTAVNLRGITRTVRLARILVAGSLTSLGIVVIAIATGAGGHADLAGSWQFTGGAHGVLQAAALLFFAFAGYARVATLGEEVRNPSVTIPRAITIALAITVGVYLLVGVAALLAAGPGAIAASPAPLATAAQAAGAGWATPVVRAGAAIASLGALLALIAGVGRTTLAMARNRDLPHPLASVHPRHQVPWVAQVAVAGAVAILVLTTDLRAVIGFSSFGVLMYYAIANASAWTQDAAHRRWPRALNVLGLTGCVVLVGSLPMRSVVAGLIVATVGVAGRAVLRRPTTAGTDHGAQPSPS
jgi:APA family basic amino acid/polyamine antiporter